MLHLWRDKKGEMLWLLLSFWISTFIVLEKFFPDHSFKKKKKKKHLGHISEQFLSSFLALQGFFITRPISCNFN